MKFEVYSHKNSCVFITGSMVCIPPQEHINSILKNGYKIKLNEKNI